MLEMVHDTSDGGEYLTGEQLVEQHQMHKYIVTSFFANDYTAGLHDIAKVLYKGDSEPEAKKVFLQETYCMMPSRILFYKKFHIGNSFRFFLDLDDIIRDGSDSVRHINYPITFFEEPDKNLGEPVLTKQLKESGEDIWYVVRVYGLDIDEHSFVGQIVYKGQSKQEAVDIWEKGDKSSEPGKLREHYYIFNPAQN